MTDMTHFDSDMISISTQDEPLTASTRKKPLPVIYQAPRGSIVFNGADIEVPNLTLNDTEKTEPKISVGNDDDYILGKTYLLIIIILLWIAVVLGIAYASC